MSYRIHIGAPTARFCVTAKRRRRAARLILDACSSRFPYRAGFARCAPIFSFEYTGSSLFSLLHYPGDRRHASRTYSSLPPCTCGWSRASCAAARDGRLTLFMRYLKRRRVPGRTTCHLFLQKHSFQSLLTLLYKILFLRFFRHIS